MGIPFFNTLILLCSGASLSWAHNSVLVLNRKESLLGMVITVVLAVIFCICQMYEYRFSSITLSDSVFGSIYFSTLSLHGSHL